MKLEANGKLFGSLMQKITPSNNYYFGGSTPRLLSITPTPVYWHDVITGSMLKFYDAVSAVSVRVSHFFLPGVSGKGLD